MFAVYKHSGSINEEIATFNREIDARAFCEFYNYELEDENCFWWDLYYEEL